MMWTSFPYRPDSSGEFEPDAVTAPEQLCQTERHMLSTIPAAWLELLCTPGDNRMMIHRAWFTCSGCHNALHANHGGDREPTSG